MRRLLALLRSSHPEPGAAVTLALTLLAVGAGHRGWSLAGVAAAVGATQLAVGWVNDWLDADRDATTGRTDKPVAAGAVSRRTVGVSGLVAAAAAPLLAVPFGGRATACIAVVTVFALSYDWPLKSTALSVLPYLVAFGALPAFVVLALPGSPAPPGWLVAAGALLGGGAHFANVLPDLADDAASSEPRAPSRCGSPRTPVAATLVLVFGPDGPPTPWGWAAAGAAAVVLPVGRMLAGRSTGRPVAMFRAVVVVALIDVGLLVLSGPVV